jgi:hypothetical protein
MEPLLNVAFNFNLRHYTMVLYVALGMVEYNDRWVHPSRVVRRCMLNR